MFTDEIYEDVLINKNGKITNAHTEVIKQKLTYDNFYVTLKQIETGYQLFRRRHPEYPEDSFRRSCFVKWSRGGSDLLIAQKYFDLLNWEIKPEYLSIRQ